MKKYFYIVLAVVVGTLTSCEMEPTLADASLMNVESTQSMRELLNGAYSTMGDYRYMGKHFVMAGEVRADNVYSNGNSGRAISFSTMNIGSDNADTQELFTYIYNTVLNPNVVIGSDMSKIKGSEADKNFMLGEAYAVRAYAYFDLIRLFGQQYVDGGNDLGISYVKEFKGDETQVARGTVEENKASLYADLQKAVQYMTEGASSQWATNKTNLTLDAVYALITRVGVYFKDYDKVRDAAQQIIGKYQITPADKYASYWSSQVPGAASIFEIAYTTVNNPAINGLAYIYRKPGYGDVMCFDNLITDAEFDANDVRASEAMIAVDANGDLRNMGKYPTMGTQLGLDNIKAIRYAEVVLNYAEALLQTDPAMALDMLNKIPAHRNAAPYTVANMENILKERRKELLFEGFRFFDLQRTSQDIPAVDPSAPNNHGLVPAGSYKFALPIPQRELDANTSSVQNSGY